MAFVDDEDDGSLRSGFSGKVVGLLALVAAVIGAKFLAPAIFSSSGGYTADRVRAEIQKNPDVREMFAAIQESYPTEYETFLQRMADTANTTKGSWPLRQQAFEFTRRLMQLHFEGFARAPSTTIRDIALQYATLFRTLQQGNVDLCGQAGTTGFTPGSEPPFGVAPIMNRIGAMQIRAARQGEAHPAAVRGAMTEAESIRLLRGIQSRSPTAFRLLQDENAMAAATREEQCEATIAIYDTIGALPPDDAAKALIQILRDSIQPARPTN